MLFRSLAKKALLTRIARLENTKARVAPILYMEGACGVRLKAADGLISTIKATSDRVQIEWKI